MDFIMHPFGIWCLKSEYYFNDIWNNEIGDARDVAPLLKSERMFYRFLGLNSALSMKSNISFLEKIEEYVGGLKGDLKVKHDNQLCFIKI